MSAAAPLVDVFASALVPSDHPGSQADADLSPAQRTVRQGLAAVRAETLAAGLPVPELRGQLLRPLVALAGAEALGIQGDRRFWRGALAIQLAHEASLTHDDVIDEAATRRGEPTTVATDGIAAALVEGDHLLTVAYRLAAATGSLAFVEMFARAVERTVAGEKRQAAARHRSLDWDTYRSIVGDKSGELFACALGMGAALHGANATHWAAAGRSLGCVYQMVDDLLDYCPHAESGKAPLKDYSARVWTWPLLDAPALPAGRGSEEIARHLFGGGDPPARRALDRLGAAVATVDEELRGLPGGAAVARHLLAGWFTRAADAVHMEMAAAARSTATAIVERVSGTYDLGTTTGRRRYFGRHAGTFRFAARLFPAAARDRVTAVYAFCRLTDDLVDRQPGLSAEVRHRLLDAWLDAARRAYGGAVTGIPVLDRAMGDMRAGEVPFRYAATLVAGARMDLGRVCITTEAELSRYTYRVASVVGLWLTELFGVRDRAVLERAAAMGHAMQLTNILRDVGADLAADRVYLPASLLAQFGLTRRHLEAMQRGDQAILPAYRALCEHVMGQADAHYARAFETLPALPASLRRPVAVAARAYQGIHDEIRRNGYDNFRRRAATSFDRKLVLGLGGLWGLRRAAVPAADLVEGAIATS